MESPPDLDSFHKYEFALFALEECGEYAPSLAELMAEPEADTLETVKQRITKLQHQHTLELQTLCAHQADEYLEDAVDRYMQFEDSIEPATVLYPLPDDVADIRPKGNTEKYYSASTRTYAAQSARFEKEVNLMRYAHTQALLPLFQRLKALESQDSDARRRRDAMFPGSVNEYRTIHSRDIELRIARFLTSDNGTRERMMSEFGWAWRQVQPLIDAFNTNAEFKTEVQDRAKAVEVKDPRRKPS